MTIKTIDAPPLELVIGPTEFRYLVAGRAIGFNERRTIKVVLSEQVTFRMMIAALADAMNPGDPPEARELVSTYRKRPRQ